MSFMKRHADQIEFWGKWLTRGIIFLVPLAYSLFIDQLHKDLDKRYVTTEQWNWQQQTNGYILQRQLLDLNGAVNRIEKQLSRGAD